MSQSRLWEWLDQGPDAAGLFPTVLHCSQGLLGLRLLICEVGWQWTSEGTGHGGFVLRPLRWRTGQHRKCGHVVFAPLLEEQPEANVGSPQRCLGWPLPA